LAEPGGILISGPVYDLVRNKLSVGFEHLGQQPVKNVSEPVTSYRIVLDGEMRPAASVDAARKPETWPVGARPQTLFAKLWSRFHDLPRTVRGLLVLVLFLFTINLFTGFDPIWFHWPAAAAALLILLRLTLGSREKRP
jgi:adenylate cyclase